MPDTTSDRLDQLTKKIETLTKDLADAARTLAELKAARAGDPKDALVKKITAGLGKLSAEALSNLDAYITFLASKKGFGGGRETPPQE